MKMIDRNRFWPQSLVVVCRWAIWCAGALVLGMAFMVTIDVILRVISGLTLINSFEIGSYIFAISLAIGLPYSFMAGAHIRINLAEKVESWTFHAIADLLAATSMAVFASFTAYYGVDALLDSLKYDVRSNSTMALPLAIPQSMWAGGLIAFAVVTVYALGRGVAWLREKHPIGLLAAAKLPDEDEMSSKGERS